MRIYMQTQYQPEQPLRFYQLHLQPDLLGGWLLVRESGMQGQKGQMKTEYFEDQDAAERLRVAQGQVLDGEGAEIDPHKDGPLHTAVVQQAEQILALAVDWIVEKVAAEYNTNGDGLVGICPSCTIMVPK